PFYIQEQGASWPQPVVDGHQKPRRAGVSSFGAGGSNAHVVIEEYVAAAVLRDARAAPVLVPLSARTAPQLEALAGALQHFLTARDAAERPGLADIAYTLQVGRDPMAERLALVVDSI